MFALMLPLKEPRWLATLEAMLSAAKIKTSVFDALSCRKLLDIHSSIADRHVMRVFPFSILAGLKEKYIWILSV